MWMKSAALAFMITLCGLAPALSADERWAYIAGFVSDNVVRVNLDTGETEVVVELDEEELPRGVIAEESGRVLVALRGGSQNIVTARFRGSSRRPVP